VVAGAPSGAVPVASARPPAGLARLWFGVFGGPAGWTLQQVAGYAVLAQSCFPGRLPRPGVELATDARVAAAAVSIGAIVLGAAAFATAFTTWRATRRSPATPQSAPRQESEEQLIHGRVAFLGLAGVLVSALFVLSSLFSGIHLVVLRSCGG
jgi:hypothetical protein